MIGKKLIFLLFCFLIIGGLLYGDERSEPKDIILALDKSLSMEEEIKEVKAFIDESIVNRLIKDDYFMVITFYGKAELAVAKQISDPITDIPVIKNEISRVFANGPFTDIGNVLDRLKEEFQERIENKRKKECFLITDGVNEPIKGSKYYSADGSFQHEYLSELKDIIVKTGWKVQFLAIGEDAKVETIADTLEADYHQVDDNPTADKIKNVVEDIIGSITIIKESILPVKIDQNGEGILEFKVATDRYLKPPEIIINSIELQSPTFSEINVLTTPFSISLPPKAETSLAIPLKVNSKIEAGDYPVELLLTFLSSERFDENKLTINLHKNSIFENHIWLLPLIIVGALALIAVIIILVSSLLRGKPMEFKVIVKEAPIPEGKNCFKLTKNKELYLAESLDVISLIPKKNRKCICKLSYLPKGIKLHILNEYRFEHPDTIPDNVLGQNIQIRTLSNKLYNIAFLSVT